MTFLVFSDLHCDRNQAAELVRLSQQADAVIGAGDFATCRRGLQSTIDALSPIDRPTFLVPGNAESIEELQDACRNWPVAHPLHGNSIEWNGVTFFGLGGAIPETPFGDWSWDHSEAAAATMLESLPTAAVLITHSPPYGFADQDSHGNHLGSQSVRQAVESKQPKLVLCGHIHASAGRTETCQSTRILNAGPTGTLLNFTP